MSKPLPTVPALIFLSSLLLRRFSPSPLPRARIPFAFLSISHHGFSVATLLSIMEGIQLPHDVVGSHDSLRHGLPAFKNDVLPVHPVEVIQRTSKAMQAQTKRTLLERAYGSAFPMKMDIERQILTRFQRPTGLIPSSMLGLESLTGELDEIGFEDFLNDPRDSDTFIPLDMHEGMEVRLGLSKGPVSRSFF